MGLEKIIQALIIMELVKKIFITLIVIGAVILLVTYQRNDSFNVDNNIEFHERLSKYELFTGDMSNLVPSKKANIYELSSPLFTDFSNKQRLIMLPENKRVKITSNESNEFPEGTILAKTFYYNKHIDKDTARRIIETRLLVKKKGKWNVAVYKWSTNQKDAILITEGAKMKVTFIDNKAKKRQTDYLIPSNKNCISCHGQSTALSPLGFKTRNLNFLINRDETLINQIEYLKGENVIEEKYKKDTFCITTPNYKDKSENINRRGKAYLDMNCAHCHNPKGSAFNSNLDFRYQTTIENSKILSKKGEIKIRISDTGVIHMPKIGTTMQDEEGIELINKFLENL